MVTIQERMMRVETKLEVIEGKLDKFIECADRKYASKLSETVVYGMVGAILTFFIGKVIYVAVTAEAPLQVTKVLLGVN